MGQKLLEEDTHGSAVSVDESSHYNPQTNRCYVELDTHTNVKASDGWSMTGFRRYLYDGQTGDLLASIKEPSTYGDIADEMGQVFVDHKRRNNPSPPPERATDRDRENAYIAADYDDAKSYMDEAMADDRSQ